MIVTLKIFRWILYAEKNYEVQWPMEPGRWPIALGGYNDCTNLPEQFYHITSSIRYFGSKEEGLRYD